MVTSARFRSPYPWLLLFLFVVVYLVNLDSLRLTRDDWANIAEMSRRLHAHGVAGTVWGIVTNDWLSPNIPRIFFGAWLVQLFVGYLGRYDFVPYYLFILVAHLAVAYSLMRIFERLLGVAWLAASLSAAYLVLPAATKVVYWLNNWFFAIPLDLLVVQAYLLVFPRRSPYAQTALLLAVTAFGQLCGEQTILMFYWSLIVAIVAALRSKTGRARSAALASCAVAFAGSALVMFGYVTRIMKFSALSTPVHASLSQAHDYLAGYWRLFLATLDPASYVFGSWTVPVSAKSAVLMALCLTGIGVAFWLGRSLETKTPDPRALGSCALALAGYVGAALTPLLYGAYTGARPGATTSYVLCTAAPFVFFVACATVWVARHFSRTGIALMRVALPAFVAYCSVLTIYSINEVWGFQKAVDNGIWRRVDQAMTERVSFIVTDNLSEPQGQLMAHWHSDAVSDFQADWGVFGRLFAVYGRDFKVGRDVRAIPGKNALRLVDYYGGSTIVPKNGGLYLAYRYGPTFYSLGSAKLYVFTRYEDFETFKLRKNGAP